MPKKSTAQTPARQRKHVAVYLWDELMIKLEEDARERRRQLGPTVIEILLEYFAEKEKKQGATPPVNTDPVFISR